MSGEHSALLDALEEAGFPRSALEGAGNAIIWHVETVRGNPCTITVAPMKDGESMKVALSVAVGGMEMSKAQCRELGAFLLAFGYRK